MKKILSLTKNYKARILRPIDWIKQPAEDIARLFGKIFFFILKNISRKGFNEQESIKSVLFIRRNKLGDAISTLPTIQSIKEKNPNVVIDVIANPYNKIVFELSNYVDNVYSIPERYFNNRYLLYFHPEIRKIRKLNKYDIAIGAVGAFSSATAWIAFCISAKNKVGVVSKDGHIMDLIYSTKVPIAKIHKEEHQVQKISLLAKIAQIISIDDNLHPPTLNTGNNDKTNNIIALCPISDRKDSLWSDENWNELSDTLDYLNISYSWIGRKPINAKKDSKTIEFKGVSNFINGLSKYSLIVCSEGGTSHIASALDIKTIVLSGVNIQKSWIPWSGNVVLYEKTNKINEIKPKSIADQIIHLLNTNQFLIEDGALFNEYLRR